MASIAELFCFARTQTGPDQGKGEGVNEGEEVGEAEGAQA